MQFSTPLIPARLIRRYKRFLADCELGDGTLVTAHCANPGSMLGLAEPGQKIWLEPNNDPRKKLRYGWRLVDHENGQFTGVDTSLPNRVLRAALQTRMIPALATYTSVRPEVPYGTRSRVDFLLQGGDPDLWLEVKSVTLSRTYGLAEFPDSVTTRGARHMEDLTDRVTAGDRAMVLFLVQRTDCSRVAPAADIDPAYAAALRRAHQAGVEVMALGTAISPQGITLGHQMPVDLGSGPLAP